MPTIMISNATELQNVNNDLSGVYQQTAAIDLTAVSFTPLGTGTGADRFAGTYDGAGFVITNLTINTPASDYVGLFGSTVGATITRVAVVGGSVTGTNYVAPIVGRNESSTITSCYATGDATASTNYAGGLVGVNSTSSVISYCYATGAATASLNFAGGLVGYNTTSSTISCYATGAATATNYAGGLVGYNSTSSVISYCYATGAATAAYYSGGLVGLNGTDCIFTACFATGNFSGMYSNRLCGRDASTAISTGACLTVAQSKDYRFMQAFNWDFDSIWQMGVVIPDLTGLDLDSAGAALYAIGCTIGTVTSQYHATVPAGQIISQGTAAGGTATTPSLQVFGAIASPKTGDSVDVVVSLGSQYVNVPSVVNETLNDAIDAIESAGLHTDVVYDYSQSVASGSVISQDPAAATSVTLASEVEITVSLGTDQITVPDVVGEHFVAATALIENAGLTVTKTDVYSTTVAVNFVVDQDPAADTLVAVGSAVEIEVSQGAEVVPVSSGIYSRMRKQNAIYWPPATMNDFGEPVYGSLVELILTEGGVNYRVRWEDVIENYIDAQGTVQQSTTTVYVPPLPTGDEVELNGYLWKGDLAGLTSTTDPTLNPGAEKIKQFKQIPNMKAAQILRAVYL